MINDNSPDRPGRRWSSRSDSEKVSILKEEMDALTPSQKKLVMAMLDDMQSGGTDVLGMCHEYRWKWEPVSMEQFMTDPYYIGEACQTVYPQLKKDLCALVGGHSYREAILTGSIGYGKTTFASIMMCRLLYELSCLKSPQLAYGLSPGSEIVVAVLSKSLHLSRTVMKSAIDDKIKLSQYFAEHFEPKISKDNTTFPGNIRMTIGSCVSERVLGMNVVGGCMDEANFMISKGQVMNQAGGKKKTVASFDLAEKVYASIVRRIKSRFLKASADLPGMMVLVSSANTMGSFIDRRLEESKDDPQIFARDYALWDVKPPSSYCGDDFKLLIGNSSLRSKILDPGESVRDEDLEDGCRLIDVPVEYFEDFSRDLENAIRDIAGISTHAVSPYIHRVDKIYSAVNNMVHAFTDEEYTYGTNASFMWSKLAKKGVRKLRGGHTEDAWVPLQNPERPRYVHIDPSLSGDSTGLAMGHIARWVEVVRRSPDGEEYNDVAPLIVIDFMLKINPPMGEQIYLPDVRRLVYELMEHGFHLSGFSCDSYQSAEAIQQMKRRGVNSSVLSVDRTTEPYEALKSAIYEDRLKFYDYRPFVEELRALEYDRVRGKVDHPIAGSKDVADAVAGVVQGLLKSAARQPVYSTGRTQPKREDHSWVTGGKIPWKDGDVIEKKPDLNGPLPIIMG